MQRTIIGFLLSALSPLLVAETVKTPPQYLILKPKKPITIDGKLDEWDMANTPYIITSEGKNQLNRVYSNDPANPVKGDGDLSGRAALAWDETCLYVAGRMIDDNLLGIKPDSFGNQGPPGWGCDSLMVQIASYRQPMKPNSPYSPIPFLGLRYAPTGPNPRGKLLDGPPGFLDKRDLYWVLTANAKWAVSETEKGYDVEAAIPWKDLEFTARPGERLFIGFLAADMDPGEALNQVGWGFEGDAKAQPVFRLADRDDLLGLLSVSADEVATDQPFAVRTELDAVKSAAKIDKLRVVDEQGKACLEEPVGAEVPQGMTGIETREMRAGSIPKPGRYVVEEWATPAGGASAVVAQVPIRIVEPTPEPPIIKNLPGEIHHMGPDRVAHNAYLENRYGWLRHGFVKSKDDYVPYIRKYVEPNLKGALQNAVKTKNPWGYVEAFRAMAMFRITDDPDYPKLARDVMDYMLDLLIKDRGWFVFTSVTRYRYLTWKQDPRSPFAPPDAEKRYRQFLHETAERPSNDLFAESGTHNRVWHRYAQLKVARMAAEEDKTKIDPRVIEYTDYHDKLIGDVGDADDASAGYHWVFWDAASAIYFYTGDWDAFVKHKGYRKTLARYVEMSSPSGACPQFASCSGWPEVGMSMWAYEWMSRITRDGRFRWSSHRIAEYYYNHLDYRASQYHLPFDTARDNFTLAYLLADDTVAPVAPPPRSRLTWRHPLVPVPLETLRARPGTSPMAMDSTRWIPDKLVLTSGNEPQGLWALVDLLPAAGHGGEVPGNIIALMIHDAALLAGQGYYENTPNFQNLLWIEDLDGLASDPRPMTTEVPIFVEDPYFSFVRIRTTPYQHLPVVYTRDIFFYKNGFLVVKDRAKFETTMKVRLGPCYQTRDLGPQCGEHWFNAYYDQLYYTGLGLGRGVQAIRNPAWDLLVYFSPRPGRKHTVLDRYMENPYRCSPVQMRQVWQGMARAGQEITFTSVLLPHVPSVTPKDFLEPPADSNDPKRIEIAQDDDTLTVVKAIGEMDPVNKIRYETWVMLNDTGKLAKAGPLQSDGLVAVVGHNHDGKLMCLAVAGGKVLVYRDKDESAGAKKLDLSPVAVPDWLLE